MKGYSIITFAIISILSLILFLPFLGAVHLFDWDEINFAEAAREMLVTGNFSAVTINFEPFWEKPPLFIWMQALSMKIFGVNAFAARFPTVLSAIATLNLIYFIGVKYFRPSVAMLWVLVYLGSTIPHFYFRTGLIDPTFNLFIFAAIYQMGVAYSLFQQQTNNNIHVVLSAIFIGLAILTKGPVALLIFIIEFLILCFFARRFFISFGSFVIAVIIIFGISAAWFLPETIKNGPWFIQRFVQYQLELLTDNVAGHQQPFYYHPMVLFFGCFPAAFFAIKAMGMQIENYREKPIFSTFHVLFWIVLIFFSIVKTKIVHYSSLCWLPLTFMAAFYIDKWINGEVRLNKWSKIILFISALPWLIILSIIPFYQSLIANTNLLERINDPFAVAIIQTPYHFNVLQTIFIILSAIAVFLMLILTLKNKKWTPFLFIVNGIAVIIVSIAAMPVVDNKLQSDLFQFYGSISNKDVYVETINFKSYAHYFYSKVKPMNANDGLQKLETTFLRGRKLQDLDAEGHQALQNARQDYLLNQKADKPIYLIYKVGDTNLPKPEQGFFSLGKKGAYWVYKK